MDCKPNQRQGGSAAQFLIGLLALVSAASCSRQVAWQPVRDWEHVREEVLAVEPLFRLPTPDHIGARLAYIHAGDAGRRLCVVELAGGRKQTVPTTNEVSQVFGWSPDDRYLAFAQAAPTTPPGSGAEKAESASAAWVTLWDAVTGAVERVGTNDAVIEGNVAWLGTNQFFLSRHKSGADYTEKFIVDWDTRREMKVRNYVSEFTLVPSNTAVFFQAGNLRSCPLDTTNYPAIQSFSHFAPDEFDAMRWLRHRAGTGTFLFCARRTNSNWRLLFEFDPGPQRLTQLTSEDTYNGQCLGQGFAYVGNTNNVFYLALRPAEASGRTNLFTGGSVVTYAASADGERVYAIAAEGMEPPGVWEYDVPQRRLRKLVSAQERPWTAARLIPVEERRVRSPDGFEVPYFVLAPRAAAGGEAGADGRRHPVVLYLPPSTWQFQRGFEQQSQLFANLGFWFVAVNYRGCDGYGRDYAARKSTPEAAADAQAVLAEVTQNPGVDGERVFLASGSDGGAVAWELLRTTTARWQGVIVDHPPGGPGAGWPAAGALPPVLLISGDGDRYLPGLRSFADWAATNRVSVSLLVQTNTGHMTWRMDQIREAERRATDFCRQQLTH